MLGFYDDSLPEVNDWHIKWALEAGISWFAFDWYWNAGEKRLMRTLEQGFLKARYNEKIKFCIHWCIHKVDWRKKLDFSPTALEEVIRYCAENYFKRPNYLMVGNRPVFMTLDMPAVVEANGGSEKFKREVLPRLNAICRDHGFGDLFIVLVNNSPHEVRDSRVGDAFTGYSYSGFTTHTAWGSPGSSPFSEMVEMLPQYWDAMHTSSLPFITSTQANWDNTTRTLGNNRPEHRWVRTGFTIDLFERNLRDGLARVRAELPYFLVEAWNEWGEGSIIEPSKEDGFKRLEAIRRVFAPDAPGAKWEKPSAKQVESYSVLKGEELLAARQREKKPDPLPVVKQWSIDVTYDPPVLPPDRLEEIRFDKSDSLKRITHMSAVEFIDMRKGRGRFKIIGNDAWLLIKGDWSKMESIQGIAMRLSYNGPWNLTGFYWQTDTKPLGHDSRIYNWLNDGEPHTYLLSFRPGDHKSGRLQSIRIGFPACIGSIVELEWIAILGSGSKVLGQ